MSGKKGLVPGNYLKEAKTTGRGGSEVEVFAADEEDMKQADAIIGGVRLLSILFPTLPWLLCTWTKR